MDSNRKTAIIVGVLFITATAMTILGTVVLIGPILDGPDYLLNVSANKNRVVMGVVLEVVVAGAVVGIGVMMFPIFRKQHEGLALGWVGGRIIEGTFILISAVGALLLLTLSQEFVKAGAPEASSFQILGTLLLAERYWTFLIGPLLVFSLNAMIVSYLLYRSRLVPRFLSVWGLIGAPLIFASALLNLFGVFGVFSPIADLMALPVASFEMALAVWLIVKGFNSSALASLSAKADRLGK